MKSILKRILRKIIPSAILINKHSNHLLKHGDEVVIYGNDTFNNRVRKAIRMIQPELLESPFEYEVLRKQMAKGYCKWMAHPSEFLLLDMNHKSGNDNSKWLTDMRRDKIISKYSNVSRLKELSYKYGVYSRLRDFFGRECISINQDTKFEEFQSFVHHHAKMFIKPEYGSFGAGSHIYVYSSDVELEEKFRDLKSSKWIAEELIVQDEEMAKWNKTSVNTVRIPSVMTSDGPEFLGVCMRVGRKGAIVDNAGGGGIILPINHATGEIQVPGRTEDGRYHYVHPDSGLKLEGQIPRWTELIELNKKVHLSMPEHKYLGNDYALTPDGWILIECNWGQFIAQYATGIGLREEFERLMAK